jgi:hypothetical protein
MAVPVTSENAVNEKGSPPICAVAIAKAEEKFIEEWLVYHHLIGVDHFFVYDNDPALPLRSLLKPYESIATVIDWGGDPTEGWPGRNLQTKTYTHALESIRGDFEWVTFLDIDEFIVTRRHATLPEYLESLGDIGSDRLNWHVFGHNGHYRDPSGLVTAGLTRRMREPSVNTKAISRTRAISAIDSAHFCRLEKGWDEVDANGKPWSETIYPGLTDTAHVNHYQCRSFLNWMGRLERGDLLFDRSNVTGASAWRVDEHLLLKQFVTTVARDKNEFVDEFMLRFEKPIEQNLASFGTSARRAHADVTEWRRIDKSVIDGTAPRVNVRVSIFGKALKFAKRVILRLERRYGG